MNCVQRVFTSVHTWQLRQGDSSTCTPSTWKEDEEEESPACTHACCGALVPTARGHSVACRCCHSDGVVEGTMPAQGGTVPSGQLNQATQGSTEEAARRPGPDPGRPIRKGKDDAER